eukprot:g7955.t1
MEQEQREREEERHRQAQEERLRAEAEQQLNEGARYLARLRPYPSSRTDGDGARALHLYACTARRPRAKLRCFGTGGAPMVFAVHGGAWAIPDEKKERPGQRRTAWPTKKRGTGPALDAVELAVRLLEDDPSLNAGRGCSLNAEGVPELDALIMEGPSLRAGAVAGVSLQHPISLARMVLEHTDHVMLAGPGAMAFAEEQGLARSEGLVTPEALEENATDAATDAGRRTWATDVGDGRDGR